VPGPVEFLAEPPPGPDEVEDVPAHPRRRPIAVVVVVAAALALGTWAVLWHGGTAAERGRPHRPVGLARPTSPAAAPTVHPSRAPAPRSGPPGCPTGVFCDVSRDQVPEVLRAVRRHFPHARTLSTYTVFRTGSGLRGGGLEYRQDAFTVPGGLLVVTIRARPTPPPYPSFRLTTRGTAAYLQVSIVDFDLDVQFTGVGRAPVSGQRLLDVADERALTALA
jgi:hypothetical protein